METIWHVVVKIETDRDAAIPTTNSEIEYRSALNHLPALVSPARILKTVATKSLAEWILAQYSLLKEYLKKNFFLGNPTEK